jgi:hypothetical protein
VGPASLSNQEILRTLGTLLDDGGCTVAVIHLAPSGARISADQSTIAEDWSLDEVAAETCRQQQQRTDTGQPSTRPWASRLGWQLRLVGAALDLAGPGRYTIIARPEEIFVFDPAGYQRTFRNSALERLAALAPEFRGQPTTCPVCGEAESLVLLVQDGAENGAAPPAVAGRQASQPTHRCRLCSASVRLVAPSI